MKRKLWVICALVMVLMMSATSCRKSDSKAETEAQTEEETSEEDPSEDDEDVVTEEQEKIYEEIKKTYDISVQNEIAEKLEKKKDSQDYTLSNMLIEYNPFGTNTQALYVYFNTDDPVSISYNIHVKEEGIEDFKREVYQKTDFQTEHEFQVIGLIPDMENTITFYLTKEDGSTDTKEIVYEMRDVYGEEEVQLETEEKGNKQELADGLYVVLGNDSDSLDFMYYYDNNGVLRGEVPLLGYRSHRLIFDDDYMYYSISEKKMVQVNRIGRVMKVYDLGDYSLHHDYVFDENGNMLILATDTTQDSVEDIVLKLDVNSGEVTEVLDLGNLLGDYKKICQKNSSGELDWMHINTIQYMGNGSVLLSSRETSSIIKVEHITDSPTIAYMIAEKNFWAGTGYDNMVLSKDGDFTIQGGQHSITYVKEASMKEGQYYLYMFNNNIGISETRPDYDWAAVGLTENTAAKGEKSWYYEYLVDENSGTFKLVDYFEVPYSGYVSSAQNIGDHTLIDSGMAAVFTEYDENHEAITSYKMNAEKFIYRVYKYDFVGFYFRTDKI